MMIIMATNNFVYVVGRYLVVCCTGTDTGSYMPCTHLWLVIICNNYFVDKRYLYYKV